MAEKVCVVLSCYNGEKYLKEQIESILHQKNVELSLVIRDDGSKDMTLSIIREYESKYQGIIRLMPGNENLGIAGSFFRALTYALQNIRAEYFAFADQDDVWIEDKLYSAVKELKRFSSEEKSLYYGTVMVTDRDLKQLGIRKVNVEKSFEYVLKPSNATGCTMVLNRKFAEVFDDERTKDIQMLHDAYVYRLAALSDVNMYYDETPHIYYRQHGANVVGERKKTTLSERLKFYGRLFGRKEHYFQRQIKYIYEHNADAIRPDVLEKVKLMSEYDCKLSSRIRLIFLYVSARGMNLKRRLKMVYELVFGLI